MTMSFSLRTPRPDLTNHQFTSQPFDLALLPNSSLGTKVIM